VTISGFAVHGRHLQTHNFQLTPFNMARSKKTNESQITMSSFHHGTSTRLSIPEATETRAGLSKGKKQKFTYNPHLPPKLRFDDSGVWDSIRAILAKVSNGEKLTGDESEILKVLAKCESQPWLEWAAKIEQQSQGRFAVDDVVLHIHERISAEAIVSAASKGEVQEQDMFARPRLQKEQALQYYRYSIDWANRIILGDSLQVMSSLARREGLAAKVQMIYIDPPYGIKFSSNWQNEVQERVVKEKDEDLN